MEIYFTADTHGYHSNLCRGSTTWEHKDECRDFENAEEMTDLLVKNINNTVKEGDILYHLGDWAFSGKNYVYGLRKRLNVKTIHLILGNHDRHIEGNSIIKTDKGFKNIQSLFTSVNQVVDKKIMGQNMVLCHYPMRAWHKAFRGSWMLHGHCHGSLPDYTNKEGMLYRTKDIGLDTHPEFRPYSFDELREIFSGDNYLDFTEDHHKRQK